MRLSTSAALVVLSKLIRAKAKLFRKMTSVALDTSPARANDSLAW